MYREKYPDHYNGGLRCWESRSLQGKLLGAAALTMGMRGPELVTNSLAVSTPILLPTRQISLLSCDAFASKWCFCFSLGRLTQIFPDTQSQMHQRGHPLGWRFVQRCDLASYPFHPAAHFPPTAKIPFCFHSICYHIQITRAPGLWTQSYSARLLLSYFLG